MEIFFTDPDDIPLPEDQVHIREITANPYPDGKRVAVLITISPFLKKPSCEIVLTNDQDEVVSTASVIETITPKVEMTLHIRKPHQKGTITLHADLFYDKFIEEPKLGEAPTYSPPERVQVDSKSISFTV